MRTMRAAVLRDFTLGIQLEDMPIPEPKPNQVLVRILASGICHTDLHAINGSWDRKPILPLIPGHEGVGVIEALGSKVTGFTLDQKVLIPWVGRTCRTCSFCFNGIENYCEKQFNTGYIIPGTHAEYTAADLSIENFQIAPPGATYQSPRGNATNNDSYLTTQLTVTRVVRGRSSFYKSKYSYMKGKPGVRRSRAKF